MKSELGLTAQEVAVVFPFHLGCDSELRLVQLGPSLAKVAPGIALGDSLLQHFRIEAPVASTFRELCHAPSELVKLRSVHKPVLLRGQTIWYPRQDALLLLCSPWLTSTAELQRNGLTLGDFAVHDPMADLLQVMQAQESTLADVRKLVSKLSAQRKEQRAANARMQSLYEVTRILASSSSVEEVAQPVLEQMIGITHFPVVALWLHDSHRRTVVLAPGNDTPRSRAFAEVLREQPPVDDAGTWQPTEVLGALRTLPTLDDRGRARAAFDAGFAVGYRVAIEGPGGSLGAFELYGMGPPVGERALLETLIELAMRMAQFIDKTRADAALRASIAVAAAAAAAKSQFLARMSHEIRTPINGVLGMIELALGAALPQAQRAQLELARSSGEILLGLVNDVLDFSKIEAGQLEIERAPFDLFVCLRRAVGLFETRAAAKRLALELSIDDRVPQRASGDELRLSQVVVNLVSNAMKFTKVGAVSVSAKLLDESDEDLLLGVEVRDTGIGIPESRRHAIFAAFTQADVATAREFGGTGLGLSICKQLVELMDGELTVESEVGKGSTFRFFLCLGKVQEAPANVHATTPEAPRPLHVLVVEDNEINQMVVRGFLERHHHGVEIADRMDTAIERGTQGTFDLILMDIQLPDGDGLTATSTIRAHAKATGRAPVPIVGLSAQAVAGDRERALAAGMDEYLTKPVRPAALADVLSRFSPATVARRTRTTELRRLNGEASEGKSSQPIARMTRAPLGSADAGSWTPADERGFEAKLAEYAELEDVLFATAKAFPVDASGHLHEMEHKLRAGDHARVAFLAHILAGSAGTLGFVSIERSARAIERLVRQGTVELLAAELGALRVSVTGLTQFVSSPAFSAMHARVTGGAGARP